MQKYYSLQDDLYEHKLKKNDYKELSISITDQ